MATIEQEEQERQRLTSILAGLKEIKAEDLVREDVLGRDLSFAPGVPYFRRMLRLFSDLTESNLDTVPYQNLQSLANIAEQARTLFKNIKDFSLSQYSSNPASSRDSLINQVRDSYDSFFQSVAPIIAYSVRKGTDFEKLERDARESVTRLNSVVADQETSRRAMLGEMEGTLEKVRRAAQEVGVAQHAIHFKDEAEQSSKSARNWLIVTAVLGALTLLFGVLGVSLILYVPDAFTPPQSIQLAIAKIILFSFLLSATLWAARIYRAARHNYVVNKHRQNALSTFETFAKAASDDATKSAVLLQATNCIFSPQQTGYIAQETEPGGFPQILEIIRKATEGPSK